MSQTATPVKPAASNQTQNGFRSDDSQYLTFALSKEEYAIEILRVQEIKGYSAITPIPNTPPHIKGVMNLRGTVVPIVDLRIKFGLPDVEYNQFTVIIVVNVSNRVVGIVVDSVSDVLNISAEEVEPPPSLGAGTDTSFLIGMAKSSDRLIAMLDIEKVIGIVDSTTAAVA
jgi:purine-binding chemotaxis protein CheW